MRGLRDVPQLIHDTVVLLSDLTNTRLLAHNGPHRCADRTTAANSFTFMRITDLRVVFQPIIV